MRRISAAWLVRLLFGLAAVSTPLFGAAIVEAGPVADEIAYPGNGKIYLIKPDGTDQRVLVSGGTQFKVDLWGGLAWSRDAGRIAFTVGNHRAGNRFGETLRLYVASGDGTNVRAVKGTPAGSFNPTWSPDGSRIAFAMLGDDETSIAVIGEDGTGLRELASSSDPDEFYWVPDWSPDGAWILFEARSFPRRRLLAVRPDGSGLHQVAALNTGNHCICADWSPGGTRIAYQAPAPHATSDRPEIWVMNADGRNRVQLTRNRTRDENPDWSPDGKRIAFYSERTGNAEIYVIPAAGGQARRVTRDPWYNGPPRWRPRESSGGAAPARAAA